MRWMLAVVAVAVLCVTIWAAWPPSRASSLGRPGGVEENRYDGQARVVVKNVDLRTKTMSVVVVVTLVDAWQPALAQVDADKTRARVSFPAQRAESPVEVPMRTRMSVPMDLPLSGESLNYPHDSYSAAITLWITVPDGIAIPALSGISRSNRELRLGYTFIEVTKDLRDWTLRQHDEATGETLPRDRLAQGWINLVDFDIKRTPQTLAFVYGVLILPLLLVLGYLVARHRAGRSWSDTRTSPLELAAALLAVVTLRQVLIPADVAGFTLLDKLLGIEVAAITAFTIISHVLAKSVDRADGG